MHRCISPWWALLSETPHKLVLIFSRLVAVVLLITAVLKLSAVAAAISELDRPDPVFAFLTTRQSLLLAAGIEAAVALTLLRWGGNLRALGLIVWLGITMAAYRGAAWLSGWTGPCHCLGGGMGWRTHTGPPTGRVGQGVARLDGRWSSDSQFLGRTYPPREWHRGLLVPRQGSARP